jgi:hypothetical protein
MKRHPVNLLTKAGTPEQGEVQGDGPGLAPPCTTAWPNYGNRALDPVLFTTISKMRHGQNKT